MTQDREYTPHIKKVDEYWKQRAKEDGKALHDLVGEFTYEVIIEATDLRTCYACGIRCNPHKAHIVPWALGGGNDVSNLFLLCPTCHSKNPDTIYPDMFFSFVRNTNYYFHDMWVHLYNGINKHYKEGTPQEQDLCKLVAEYDDDEYVRNRYREALMAGDQATGVGGQFTHETRAAISWKSTLKVGESLFEPC